MIHNRYGTDTTLEVKQQLKKPTISGLWEMDTLEQLGNNLGRTIPSKPQLNVLRREKSLFSKSRERKRILHMSFPCRIFCLSSE